MRPMSRPLPCCLAILVTLSALAGPARAGSGRYDKESRSFSLTYMYLDLPSGVLDEAQALSVARPRRPDASQAQNIQIFWQKASDLLFKLTAGRARIGALEETREIAKADAIISLTGTVRPRAGGAWAGQKGWNVASATLNIYYQDMVNERAQSVTETVVHELFHYFVGLPDEYPRSPGTAPLCPRGGGPGGLRCFMDNFHYGSIGLCTAADHNRSAPGANGFLPVTPVNLSCQELLDQFFTKLGVQVDPNAVNPGVGGAVAGGGGGAGGGDMAAISEAMKASVLVKARDEVNRIKARRGKGRLDAEDRSQVRGFIVRALVDFVKTAGGAKPTNIGGFAEKLTSELLLSTLGVPPGLSLIEPFLRTEAARLGRQILDPKGKSITIATELITLARQRLQRTPGVGASPTLTADDILYLETLAKQAAAGQDVTGPGSPAQLQAELQREMYQTLLDIANEMKMAGAVDRLNNFNRITQGLVQAGLIPDRNLDNRFGRRRTVVIEPPVLVGKLSDYGLDNAETQGYSDRAKVSNYNDLRALSLREFEKLIDRSRIEVLTATSYRRTDQKNQGTNKALQGFVQAGPTPFVAENSESVFDFDKKQGLAAQVRPEDVDAKAKAEGGEKLDAGLVQQVLDARKARIKDSLALIKDQIERDRIENIVLLVPPRGLPEEFGEALIPIREQFLNKTDLRLDIALIGASAWIPDELRDIVTRTRGSILTVSDIDEVGAVAQRLAGQQTQGTWVTIPQQDYLLIDAEQPNFDSEDGGKADLNFEQDGTLFKRLRGMRRPHLVRSDADRNVVLKPFYVDPATRYELIVGLTQPLTIAGLPDPSVKPDPATTPGPIPPVTPPPVVVPPVAPKPGDCEQVTGNQPPPILTLPPVVRAPIPGVQVQPADEQAAAPDTSRDAISRSDKNLKAFPEPTLRLVPGQVRDDDEIRALEGPSRNLIYTPTPDLKLNLEKSTPTILVFDLPPGTETGWYNPVLKLSGGNFKDTSAIQPKHKEGEPLGQGTKRAYRNQAIHFTFSVGTQTSKAQMIAGLMQDLPSEITSTDQGTVNGPAAYLSAVLTAGAAVLDAEVIGLVQRLEEGIEPIATERVTFHDDGVAPDKQRDDGIYSAKIPLPSRRETRAEYRVFVEGRSIRDRTRFVPAGEPALAVAEAAAQGESKEAQEDVAKPPTDRKAPAFQRATSIQFTVPARGGR